MSFYDFLFKMGIISEDSWRDKWHKNKCDFCFDIDLCRPWGAWSHQDLKFGGRATVICKRCEGKKLNKLVRNPDGESTK